jgi:hypothetical protein
MAVAGCVLASAICMSPAASLAITAPIHIHGTGGDGVFIRPTPDTSQPARGWMPEGASPDYNCFTYGQMIGNVNVWFSVNYNGVTGFYASYYDDSSYHSEAELTSKYGIPKCGAPPPNQPPSNPPPNQPPSNPPPETPPTAPPTSTPPSGGDLTFSVYNADGGIYYRNSPHWADTSARAGVGVYNGDRVQLVCGSHGDAVGPGNNTAWSYVRNLTRPTIGPGWVSEHFIDDGAPPNAFPAGEPDCGGTTPGVPPPGGGSPPPARHTYDRSAGVGWALAHAKDGQEYLAQCTWFVSRALWAGGFPKTADWTSDGTWGDGWPGTKTAWTVGDLVSYLARNHDVTQIDITPNFRTNAVPQAQPGDIILYDWGAGDHISHMALVVDIARGQYPEVAEQGQFSFNDPFHIVLNRVRAVRSPYVKRGWTWSELHGQWLQQRYPGVKAYLLHINGIRG